MGGVEETGEEVIRDGGVEEMGEEVTRDEGVEGTRGEEVTRDEERTGPVVSGSVPRDVDIRDMQKVRVQLGVGVQ